MESNIIKESLTTHAEWKDKVFGKIGTKKRNNYEKALAKELEELLDKKQEDIILDTISVKVIGLTELNKKYTFIVLAKDLSEAVIKAEGHVFKGTKLKIVKTILSLEVIATTKNNNLLL